MPEALRAVKPALKLVPPAPAPRTPEQRPHVQAMIAANDTIVVPLHGRIAAGLPVEALESDRSMSVPAALLGPGDHYALEVSGDSMIEAGIFDGDYALIKRCDDARDGDIVVALIDGAEATLKYLHREKQYRPARSGQCRLSTAALRGAAGAGAGQARRVAAPVSLGSFAIQLKTPDPLIQSAVEGPGGPGGASFDFARDERFVRTNRYWLQDQRLPSPCGEGVSITTAAPRVHRHATPATPARR